MKQKIPNPPPDRPKPPPPISPPPIPSLSLKKKAMFIKQHYQAIADIINKAMSKYIGDDSCYWVLCDYPDSIIPALANYFEKDNPNFDKDKFLKACGLDD